MNCTICQKVIINHTFQENVKCALELSEVGN
jgi:hypothetical protein